MSNQSLLEAIANHDNAHVLELIQSTGDLNFRYPDGNETALCRAAELGNHVAIQMLIDHGADIHLPDQNGISPLMITCMNDHPKCAELLLMCGANPDQANNYGVVPLEISTDTQVNDLVCTELLLRFGATITETVTHRHKTPEMAELIDAYISRIVLEGGAIDIPLVSKTTGPQL